MTDSIESYVDFQLELAELIERAEESDLDQALIAGILLDYRDHIKMKEGTPEVSAGLNKDRQSINQ